MNSTSDSQNTKQLEYANEIHSREIKELKDQNLLNIKSYEIKISELTQNNSNLEIELKNITTKLLSIEKEKIELLEDIQNKINHYEQQIESSSKEKEYNL